ncbi:MAG: sugar ABC transporter permease [Clostridiales bacterium]|nr:sugar ABC transporter permease [Clostridiales bacterium]
MKVISEKKERQAVLKPSSARRWQHIKDNLITYAMFAPNLIMFLAFSLYPVLWTLKYVFYRYSGFGATQPVFVGLSNLIRVFQDQVFWKAVRNTFVYAGGKVLIVLPISFLLAVILNKQRRVNGTLQSLVFTPTIMSSAVMGLVFYLLFNVYNGQINKILTGTGLVSQNINWLGKENAMKTLILVAVWGAIGNYMVYFIAGLQQISKEALESACLDGANPLQTMWHITLPMMGPVLKTILMLAITAAFSDMNSVMVLTEGGPVNSTMTMALYGYSFFFSVSESSTITPQYGYGAAVSFVSACIAGIVTVVYLKLAARLDDIY